MAYRGIFNLKNPSKYLGNPEQIVWRSLWERRVMNFLDNTENVLQWASEPFAIPYQSPLDGRVHRYFPDFFIKLNGESNKVETLVVEVKPYSQSTIGKRKKLSLNEASVLAVNRAKWESAVKYCHSKGWTFRVLTEKDIFQK